MNPLSASGIDVVRWKPGAGDSWATLITRHGHANLAQSPEWFTAISRAYGHLPVFLQASDGVGDGAVLPSFFIPNRLFGSVVSSMPFLDAGGPCGTSDRLVGVLLEALKE